MGQGSQPRPRRATGSSLSGCRRWGTMVWGFITMIWITVFVVVMTLFMAIVERGEASPSRPAWSDHSD